MMEVSVFGLASETVLGIAFWTLFHGLGPMIWFYPLNELNVTGYEAFVAVVYTPILLVLAKDTLLKSKIFYYGCLCLLLVGVVSFQAGSTLHRLVQLSIGTGSAVLVLAVSWWSADESKKKYTFWGYTIAFNLLVSLRVWYTSITPIWNDVTSNQVFAAITLIAVSYKIFGQSVPSAEVQNSTDKTAKKSASSSTGLLSSSLAFGAINFMMNALFAEASILCRYTVKGYPDTGPLPNPYGGAVILALLLGVLMSFYTDISSNLTWSVIAFLSSMGLMFLDTWVAFACGLILCLYIMSVWPVIASNVVRNSQAGLSLMIAHSVYLIGVFGMVWCTAYNFVPFGGELARERTYVIIAVMMLPIMYCALNFRKSESEDFSIKMELPKPKEPSDDDVPAPDRNAFTEVIRKILFAVAMVGLLGFNFRQSLNPPMNILGAVPVKEQPREFSALIWTFHFGYDNRGWPSFERAAQVLNDTGADVITLLESDASKPYLGNNDIAMWLGEKLGMYSDFGPSTRDHTWGNILLSKYPIVRSEHHLLPSPHGELAPAISATVNMSGNLVDFVVTHMGNDRDNLDRRLQAEKLSQLCADAENPVVFLGYVTSAPGSRDYRQLTTKGRMKDIDATDRDRWCEYIMYRGLTKQGYARISHAGLSDTELQMARWRIPLEGEKETDNLKIASTAKDLDRVPGRVKFNDKFGERFVGHYSGRKHHFHMSTPKYFVP